MKLPRSPLPLGLTILALLLTGCSDLFGPYTNEHDPAAWQATQIYGWYSVADNDVALATYPGRGVILQRNDTHAGARILLEKNGNRWERSEVPILKSIDVGVHVWQIRVSGDGTFYGRDSNQAKKKIGRGAATGTFQAWFEAASPIRDFAISPVDGSVYATLPNEHQVIRIDPVTALATVIAGSGQAGAEGAGDGGPATLAPLGGPRAVAVADDGTVYFTDLQGYQGTNPWDFGAEEGFVTIRKVDVSGVLSTVAFRAEEGDVDSVRIRAHEGIPARSFSPGESVTMSGPDSLDVDADGNVYWVSIDNDLWQVSPGGTAIILNLQGPFFFPDRKEDKTFSLADTRTSIRDIAVDRKNGILYAADASDDPEHRRILALTRN